MNTHPVLVSRRPAVLCALLGLAAPAARAGDQPFLATPMLAATDERVFVTARYTLPASAGDAASAPSGDVVEGSEAPSKGPRAKGITVLDAKTGNYVETPWPDWRIIGLGVFADMLAVATGDGVVLVALK